MVTQRTQKRREKKQANHEVATAEANLEHKKRKRDELEAAQPAPEAPPRKPKSQAKRKAKKKPAKKA